MLNYNLDHSFNKDSSDKIAESKKKSRNRDLNRDLSFEDTSRSFACEEMEMVKRCGCVKIIPSSEEPEDLLASGPRLSKEKSYKIHIKHGVKSPFLNRVQMQSSGES